MVLQTHLYDVLMVSVTATLEEISRSYKKLALKYHPDKTNHDPDLTEKFKAIANAYEVLRDTKLRQIYDMHGQEGLDGSALVASPQDFPLRSPSKHHHLPKHHPNGYGYDKRATYSLFIVDADPNFDGDVPFLNPFGHSGFSDFHGHLYSYNDMPYSMNDAHQYDSREDFTSGPAPRRQDDIPKERSVDIHHILKVTLADMYFGKTVKFLLPKMKKCSHCNGQGCMRPEVCLRCEGSGRVYVTMGDRHASLQENCICGECKGRGIAYDPYDVCQKCDNGYFVDKEYIKVYVLPGSKHGDLFVLSGKGDEGRDIIPGDVVISLEEIPHSFLIRKGDDLYMERDIDLRTALTGGRIVISNYLKEGHDVAVSINVHGQKELNDLIHESLHEGEVVGPIDSRNLKLVKGLGMPINPLMKKGVHYQVCKDFSMKDSSSLVRGDLCIRFNVIVPSLREFKDDKVFAKFIDLLPGSSIENPVGKIVKDAPLSNMQPEPHLDETQVLYPDLPILPEVHIDHRANGNARNGANGSNNITNGADGDIYDSSSKDNFHRKRRRKDSTA